MPANLPLEMETLTPREHQIYVLATEGKSNQNISETLGISVNTVRTHIEHIKRKLRTQGHRGWVSPPQQDDPKDLPTS